MASGPMQTCCVSGVLHEGTPVGEVKDIGNTRAYFAHPPASSTSTSTHAILILTDVYGFTFPNTRLIADNFASLGYLTVIPDLFHGAEVPFPPPSDFNLQTYINDTMPRFNTVDPIIESVIKVLREDMGVKRLGAVGYCFGGKYVCRWLREGMGKVDVGYVAHPSFVEREELQGIEGALSIAAAEVDEIFTVAKRYETEEILTKKKATYQIFLYSGVEHGFAVKGHMSTAKARFAKEQAFLQAVAWFDEYVKKDKSGL
ncbi:dienelactone hydrolase [Phaeosphaeria sp. MPI-PUGE-AT-0046c]|nr:dienelactone hydrolase [Phaeosphaeria sp. MPI-PUGE-AT-0046c]